MKPKHKLNKSLIVLGLGMLTMLFPNISVQKAYSAQKSFSVATNYAKFALWQCGKKNKKGESLFTEGESEATESPKNETPKIKINKNNMYKPNGIKWPPVPENFNACNN